MDSILFLVVVMALNLIFKSANDKKKMEAARRKRIEELKKNPQDNSPESRMKRWVQESEKVQKRVQEFTIDATKETKPKEYKTVRTWEISPSKPVETISKIERVEVAKEKPIGIELDIHKNKDKISRDSLVNAIIWSEILGKPKSVQNIRRGM